MPIFNAALRATRHSKAHICIDPGSELIDEVAVTPANAPDAQAVDDLLASHADDEDKPEVVGDSAYGSAAARSDLEAQGYPVTAKAAPVRNSTGGFTKEDFAIDLEHRHRHLPRRPYRAGAFRARRRGQGLVQGPLPPLPAKKPVHTFTSWAHDIGPPPRGIAAPGRAEQKSPEWQARYKATRPIVERKVSHFTRRPWGGRRPG